MLSQHKQIEPVFLDKSAKQIAEAVNKAITGEDKKPIKSTNQVELFHREEKEDQALLCATVEKIKGQSFTLTRFNAQRKGWEKRVDQIEKDFLENGSLTNVAKAAPKLWIAVEELRIYLPIMKLLLMQDVSRRTFGALKSLRLMATKSKEPLIALVTANMYREDERYSWLDYLIRFLDMACEPEKVLQDYLNERQAASSNQFIFMPPFVDPRTETYAAFSLSSKRKEIVLTTCHRILKEIFDNNDTVPNLPSSYNGGSIDLGQEKNAAIALRLYVSVPALQVSIEQRVNAVAKLVNAVTMWKLEQPFSLQYSPWLDQASVGSLVLCQQAQLQPPGVAAKLTKPPRTMSQVQFGAPEQKVTPVLHRKPSGRISHSSRVDDVNEIKEDLEFFIHVYQRAAKKVDGAVTFPAPHRRELYHAAGHAGRVDPHIEMSESDANQDIRNGGLEQRAKIAYYQRIFLVATEKNLSGIFKKYYAKAFIERDLKALAKEQKKSVAELRRDPEMSDKIKKRCEEAEEKAGTSFIKEAKENFKDSQPFQVHLEFNQLQEACESSFRRAYKELVKDEKSFDSFLAATKKDRIPELVEKVGHPLKTKLNQASRRGTATMWQLQEAQKQALVAHRRHPDSRPSTAAAQREDDVSHLLQPLSPGVHSDSRGAPGSSSPSNFSPNLFRRSARGGQHADAVLFGQVPSSPADRVQRIAEEDTNGERRVHFIPVSTPTPRHGS